MKDLLDLNDTQSPNDELPHLERARVNQIGGPEWTEAARQGLSRKIEGRTPPSIHTQ